MNTSANRKLAIMLVAVMSLVACKPADEPATNEMQAQAGKSEEQNFEEHARKHLDPTYVCPMHPEVTSDEPGECPICGMTLVERESPESRAQQGGQDEILYYRHPHNPQVTSPTPAKDEMGMDFIPVRAASGGTVTISPGMSQNLGVRTAIAERGKLWRRIDTVGYIDYNESLLRHIHPRAAGWIETLNVRSEGERVSEGDVLFNFYSPDIINAQEEFIAALNSGNARLQRVSRERLAALDVAEQDIARIERNRRAINPLPFYAPRDEVVAELHVREGMYVTPAMEVMSLADLSNVWLVADVFAAQSAWLAEGQPVEATLPYRPGETWEGKVDFVSPVLDPKTRTVQARLKFANPGESLKPNMFANVTIFGGPKTDIVIIPREALIRTGKEARVIMQEGESRFSSRVVVPGMESGDYVEIIAGIEAGEKVVTSGQFLIDSEASLNASLQRLEPTQASSQTSSQTLPQDQAKEDHAGHDAAAPDKEGEQ